MENNQLNSGTLNTLTVGDCLLTKAFKTSTDKIQLEFAEKVGDSIQVDNLNYDINYLNSFLPKLMGEKETHQIIIDIIDKNKFTSKDFGRIMGILKKDYNNKIDLNSASKLVKDIFNE